MKVKRSINNYVFFIILFTCLFGQSGRLSAFHQIADDTTHIDQKSFNNTQLEAFKADKDFQYKELSQAGLSWWDRFKLMIGLWLSQLFSAGGGSPFLKILIYTLCALAVIYVVLKLLKIDIRHIFYRSARKSRLQYHSIDDDIHAMDFDTLIKQAVSNNNFREAVRLIYLAALKQLSDHDHLHWKIGKTNHEYMDELSGTAFKEEFDQLSYYFEYSWYGQFTVSRTLYADVSKKYQSLTDKIK